MIKINRFILSNGLRVVHHNDPDTKIAVVNVLYNVGGKNDNPLRTGYAHLFEHLMFSGSKNVPDFDTLLQEVGGKNNAYTTRDITNYYDVLPAQNVETAFFVESDRMAYLNISEHTLAAQKSVVMEEFKQRNLNRPYGDVSSLYRSMAYKKHPYRIPIIGKALSHIAKAKMEDVLSYYENFYSPDNAVLSVVGNISLDECRHLSEKWFGDIPARKVKTPVLPQEPKQRKARFVSVERDVPASMIYKVYHMTSRSHEYYTCFDLISDILALGKSSRLNKELVVNRKMFTAVDSVITGDIDSGLLIVTARLASGVTMQEADAALSAEILRLSSEPVSDRELEKVMNKSESVTLFENIDITELAARLAYYELLGNANLINRQSEIYRSVDAKKIMKVAAEYLKPANCSTLYYNAKKRNFGTRDKKIE